MEKLTAEQLKLLSWGDKVYRFDGWEFRGLRFVGKMHGCEKYLIFSDGEYLTHLYISDDNSFAYTWYNGDYNSKFVGNLKLQELERRKEGILKIHLNE